MSDPLRERFEHFLSDRYSDARLSDFAFLASGVESEIYAFTLRHDSLTVQSLVLRLFSGDGADRKMAKEAKGLRFLRRVCYPVPELLFYETDPLILGTPFSVLERIPGGVLWAMLYQMDAAQANSLLERFGALIAELHGLNWRSFTDVNSQGIASQGLLDEELAHYRILYNQYDLPGLLAVVDWLDAKQVGMPLQPAIVHRDFHAGNVLVGDDGAMTVIDWTQASVSDYRADLAWTLLLMGDFGQSSWRTIIRDAYEAATGHPVTDLDYFDALSVTKLLGDTIISLKATPEAVGLRPETVAGIGKTAPVLAAQYQRLCDTTGLTVPEVEAMLSGFGVAP